MNPELVKNAFAKLGEMQKFFEIIRSRGLVFVTYFDLRSAIAAKERMHGMEFGGRKVYLLSASSRELI